MTTSALLSLSSDDKTMQAMEVMLRAGALLCEAEQRSERMEALFALDFEEVVAEYEAWSAG